MYPGKIFPTSSYTALYAETLLLDSNPKAAWQHLRRPVYEGRLLSMIAGIIALSTTVLSSSCDGCLPYFCTVHILCLLAALHLSASQTAKLFRARAKVELLDHLFDGSDRTPSHCRFLWCLWPPQSTHWMS